MEISRTTIKPSDVGLKEWDAFYHPELLNVTQGLELSNSGMGLGTKVTMGALILMLNSPLQDVAKKITINTTTTTETTATISNINNLVACLDAENTIYEREIETVIKQNRFIFEDKDLMEQEIIDAYMKEVGSIYPKKRKIVL